MREAINRMKVDKEGVMKTLSGPNRKVISAMTLAVIAVVALGTIAAAADAASTASSASSQQAGQQITAATSRMATIRPAKYRIVKSGWLSAAAGTDVAGSAMCPLVGGTQTKPTDGGVFISSTSTQANVNSSYPAGNAWDAAVNNNTSSATSFEVYAICSMAKTTYTVQSAPFDAPAGNQAEGVAACPPGYQLLGGGVAAGSRDLNVNINLDAPLFFASAKWDVFINNNSSGDSPSTVYAICSVYPSTTTGYSIAHSPTLNSPPATQDLATAACPVVNGIQTSVLGGGASDSSFSLLYDVNAIWPDTTTSFSTYVNNGDPNDQGETFLAFAICAY